MAEVAAAVFGGFKVLQPLNLVFNGSFTVLLRFGISPSKIGCFIGDTGACKKFWCIVGDLLAVGFTFTDEAAASGICAVSSFVIFLTNIILFYVCLRSSGYDGVRRYFWLLCLSGGVNQFDSVVGGSASGGSIPWFFFAMELYTVFLPTLFGIVTMFGKWFGFDIEFWKLVILLFSMCLLTFVSFVLWFVHGATVATDTNNKRNTEYTAYDDALIAAVSPWFMGFVGFGIIFCVFPVVWPFMVCHFSRFRFVMLFGPALGCIATLIPWVINEFNNGMIAREGGQVQTGKYKEGDLKFHDWTETTAGGYYWNFTWLFVPGCFLLFPIIMSCVHYPRCFVARCVLHSRWAVVFGSLFFFFSQSAKAFGLTGCASNSIGRVFVGDNAKTMYPSKQQKGFNSSCFALSIITMTISLFTTQAYSVGIGSFRCAIESGCSWPTQGVGGFRSFWFWLHYGVRHGTNRFIESGFLDVISAISKGLRIIINLIRNVLP